MVPETLAARGIEGPAIGKLQREGSIQQPDGEVVRVEEVSEPRRGQCFAFLMDTRLCDAAFELAVGADMLVCESTFLESEAELAEAYRHLTAAQAARIALEAGVRLLVLTHFSQRYPDISVLREEAAALFPNVVAARDLTTIPVPVRE
jgi:ribonuclease Z